jgi:hypothetical protein
MKIHLSEFDLLTLISDRITHLAAERGIDGPCGIGGIVATNDANANWTWNAAYPERPGCVDVVEQAVSELQKTHDVNW